MERAKQNIFWYQGYNLKELVGFFKAAIKNIKLLAEKNIYHSDYKPANFVLKRTLQDLYVVMIIDCGSASLDWKEIKAYTLRYIIDTKNYDENWAPTFETPFARLRTEFKLIARTIFSVAT